MGIRGGFRRALAGVAALSSLGLGAMPAGAAVPAVTLDQSVDLASPSSVVVSWSGFSEGGTSFSLAICDGAVQSTEDCGILGSVNPSASGSTTVIVSATFAAFGGPLHDCRMSGACVIAVTQFVPDLVTASAPVSFAGTSSIGTLTVDPASDLDDGESVIATLAGWSGSDSIRLEQCQAFPAPCRMLATFESPSDRETTSFSVSRFLPDDVTDADCASGVACFVRATSVVGGADVGSRQMSLEFFHRGPFSISVAPIGPYADGQVVGLSGQGLSRALSYTARQCLAFVPTCDPPVVISPAVDGTFSLDFTVRDEVAGTSCRFRGLQCSLIVEGTNGAVLQQRSVNLQFAPIAFEAVPSTGLAAYQPVVVRSTVSGRTYTIEQCGPAGPCTVKAHGSAGLEFVKETVRVTRRVGPEFSVDCVMVQCEMRLSVDGMRVAGVPLAFAQPPTSVSVRPSVAYETDGVAFVKIALSRSTDSPVTVTVATFDGSATAPADYTTTTTMVVIPAGDRVGYAVFPVASDEVAEGSEQFGARIVDVAGAWRDRGRAEVTLFDTRVGVT